MHVISQKRVWEAQAAHKDAATALEGWYRIIKSNTFENFAQLRRTFPSVDKVNDKYVFNIGGNKLRLIANINFERNKLFIRCILTHKDYDKERL